MIWQAAFIGVLLIAVTLSWWAGYIKGVRDALRYIITQHGRR